MFWVIDPLDEPQIIMRNSISAVSIALVEKNNPVLGVIYDFNTDELYEGSVSSKALMNDKSIYVSDIKDKYRGTLLTGLPVAMDYDKKYANTYRQLSSLEKSQNDRVSCYCFSICGVWESRTIQSLVLISGMSRLVLLYAEQQVGVQLLQTYLVIFH